MSVTIHTIPLGIDHVYVIKERGTAIIDAGEPNKGLAFPADIIREVLAKETVK